MTSSCLLDRSSNHNYHLEPLKSCIFLFVCLIVHVMGGGFFVTDSSHREEYEEGGVTSFVVIACIVAAMGGLLFGYDIGISG